MLLVAEAGLAQTSCPEDVEASAVASEEVEAVVLGAVDQMLVSDVVEATQDTAVEAAAWTLDMAHLAPYQSRSSVHPLVPLHQVLSLLQDLGVPFLEVNHLLSLVRHLRALLIHTNALSVSEAQQASMATTIPS